MKKQNWKKTNKKKTIINENYLHFGFCSFWQIAIIIMMMMVMDGVDQQAT